MRPENEDGTTASVPPFRVLVTGFGPYGNTSLNPSLAVVKALQQREIQENRKHNIQIIAAQVSSEFDKCIAETRELIDQHAPLDAVISLGEYPGRAQITVERVAINYNDATRYGVTDEAGEAPQGTKVVPDDDNGEAAPPAYFTTLPIRRIVRDLRASGIPADISDNAGTLMCNHLMYGVLHATAGTEVICGWIHLPALPEQAATEANVLANIPSMSAETSTKAVICAIQSMYEHRQWQWQSQQDCTELDLDVPVRSRLMA